jgi:hypothetical protein
LNAVALSSLFAADRDAMLTADEGEPSAQLEGAVSARPNPP